MRALIHGTRVCQIEAQEFVVASPLRWVECDGTVTTQHSYVGGQFRPPQPSEFHAWDGSAWAIPPANQAAADAAAVVAARAATDSAECITDKADAQIMADMNATKNQTNTAINNAFTDPAQATIIRRLAALVKHAARGQKLR